MYNLITLTCTSALDKADRVQLVYDLAIAQSVQPKITATYDHKQKTFAFPLSIIPGCDEKLYYNAILFERLFEQYQSNYSAEGLDYYFDVASQIVND